MKKYTRTTPDFVSTNSKKDQFKHRRNNGADKDAVRLIISFGVGVSEPDEFLKKSKSRSNGSRKALRKESTKTAMKAEIEIIAISSMLIELKKR